MSTSTFGDVVQVENNNSFYFEWIINNYCSVCYIPRKKIHSPYFVTKNNRNKWFLTLSRKNSSGFYGITVSLFLKESIKPSVQVTVRFSIISRENIKLHEKEMKNISISTGNSSLEENFALVADLQAYRCRVMHSNQLKILCEISEASFLEEKILNLHHVAFDNFRLLFESETFSDVTLIVKGRSFSVRKAILAANSEVFCAIFENDMKEKEENRVVIKDIDDKVMEQVIYCIYTGSVKIDDFKKLVREVLAASEKYALEGLKEICAEVLRDEINSENASETLILANTYNAERLRGITLNFIVGQGIREIMKTTGFQLLEQSHKHLLKDILVCMVEK